MFKVGQRVVALISYGEVIEKDKIYVITDVVTCPHCGICLVSYGVASDITGEYNRCTYCHVGSVRLCLDEWYVSDENFAPIQEYGDSMSIAMELIQDMERVDKPVNPKVKEVV